MGIVCIDGESHEEVDPIPGEAPAYHFKEGVYETLRTVRGRLFNWLEHRIRLEASAESMGFKIPRLVVEDIGMYAQMMVVRNQQLWGDEQEAKVRIQVDPDCHYYVQITPLSEVSDRVRKQGISVETVEMERLNPKVKAINPEFVEWAANIKKERGVRELLLVNEQGNITEGSMSNVFIVTQKGVLVTPGEGVLEGTTRARILQLAKELKISVELGSLTREEVYGAREVFICSVSSEAIPVVSVDGRKIETGNPGYVTFRLAKALKDSRLESR
jgi:branched-subunit amino acid aminotransferase/4-amino-4-deoxychorismate lyase